MAVIYESTPNPQAMKFVVTDRQIANENVNFADPSSATRSPLAKKLFGFPWAAGVFIGPNFVTVTKQDWVKWEVLADPLAELIDEHVSRGEAVLLPAVAGNEVDTTDDSPVVRQIKKILELEIRPAVAMDGGDITFAKYEDGRLYLHLQGSCSGCPSSAFTLKEGIETRLRAEIPELTEVVAL
jgi:NFU1 iron-sulfur cluster scaffold homolog, mitochondrial